MFEPTASMTSMLSVFLSSQGLASNAYGLQTHFLGNNGTGITHEIWASFNTVQDALTFLSGLNNSKEFAEYGPKAREYSKFKRSYMEVSLKQYNPD